MRKRARKSAKTPVQELPLKESFRDLTAEQDWHGDEEKETVRRYRDLLKALQKNVSGVKVFEVGSRNVSVFIVGQTEERDWAGLRTTAVQK